MSDGRPSEGEERTRRLAEKLGEFLRTERINEAVGACAYWMQRGALLQVDAAPGDKQAVANYLRLVAARCQGLADDIEALP